MKLLIVTQTVDTQDPILGFFCRWIIEFAKRFEKVTVIALSVGECTFPDNINVLSLGKKDGVSRMEYVRRFYSYIISCRNDYDVVFVHMNPVYVILGGLLWRIWNKKIGLWYVHKNVDIKLRTALCLVHIVFTASEKSFRIHSPKVMVTGHGIDTSALQMRIDSPQRPVITTIGRITKTKNIDVLLDAFALAKKFLSAQTVFEIVGDAVYPEDRIYKNNLEQKIRDLGITNSVVFVGTLPHAHIPNYLNHVSLVLNASDTGSLDKAILEPMAMGIPVVTSNEAFRDVLSPQGLFVEQTNKEIFASKIQEIMSHNHFDGRPLRAIVEKQHALTNLIDSIQSIYEAGR